MNDIKYYLVKYINSIDDLKNFCMQDKSFYNICKTSKQTIAAHFLNIHKVDYKNPENYIYKYNKVDIKDYIIDSVYNLQSIFKLYMKSETILLYTLETYKVDYKDPNSFIYKYSNAQMKDYIIIDSVYNLYRIYALYGRAYRLTEINCINMMITSIPIFPKMIKIRCENNKLTTFPIQPEMIEFHGIDNQLTTFPIQPKMECFNGNGNQLTTFPIQPKMEYFNGNGNQLTTFPIQPNMIHFECSKNELTTFPIQPQMREFYGEKNQLTTLRY